MTLSGQSSSTTTGTTGTTTTDTLGSPLRKRSGTVGMGVAVALAIVLLLVGLGGGYVWGNSTAKSSSTSSVQLTETGSSLLYPLMTSWAAAYTGATISAASTGSGTGQSDAETGLVNIGASDGYLTTAAANNLINVPVAISAQLVYYNLPGLTGHLNLNGTMLAEIYNGTITTWNDPLILNAQNASLKTALNGLASETIHPIKRADSSGDTFLFTSFCYESWAKWPFGYGTSNLTGDTAATGATGNSGMVSALNSTANSVAYVGISYEASAGAEPNHLQYAALGDNNASTTAGGIVAANYILPTSTTISQDANLGLNGLNFTADQLEISLILGGSSAGPVTLSLGGGGSMPTLASPAPYPIVNLEYMLIKTAPTGSVVTSTALAATVAFLQWAISIGNWASGGTESTFLSAVHFIPLTPAVAGYDMQELATVQP